YRSPFLLHHTSPPEIYTLSLHDALPISICHRFHTIEAALSRWLLAVQDRANSDTLNLTQETISNALGVPRTGVTTAAGSLQRAGDRKSTRLNSSHLGSSYAVFCLKKKTR